jgi:glycosyltransferase involved in cell wall biosynthesis
MGKKVVWVINQFAGNPGSGWGERHFYLARYWKEAGFDVKIITGSFNHMFNVLPDVKGLYLQEAYEGVDFIWVKTPKYHPRSVKRFFSMLVFARNVLKLPVEKFGKPSTIIVSSMPIFPIWSGIRLKRKFGAKLIFEIRDIWPLTLQLLGGYSTNHPVVRFIGWFEKIGYRESDVVVSLLPNAREHFEGVARQKVNFKYIPNGIDEDLLKAEELPADFTNKIPGDKFIIGYTGTLGLANALQYFLGAAELLKNDPRFFFVIVGDGYLKNELEAKSSSWGNMLFLPKIRKNQVQKILRHFDACFVGWSDTPLYQHGVSANKYFDYMLAGKPILASCNLIKEPVELSGCGIIVKPGSAETIKDGLIRLYNMPGAEREKMGEKGLAYVKEFHNIKNLADSYAQLFN